MLHDIRLRCCGKRRQQGSTSASAARVAKVCALHIFSLAHALSKEAQMLLMSCTELKAGELQDFELRYSSSGCCLKRTYLQCMSKIRYCELQEQVNCLAGSICLGKSKQGV